MDTDVSNTALILAVRLLNMNQLLCPEWVSEWHSATFNTVCERESHPHWRESRSRSTVTESAWRWITFANVIDRANVKHVLLRITFTNVSDFNSSALSEWVSDTAPLSVQYMNDNHVLIDVNHEWISRSQTTCWGRESCSHSTVTESAWTWITFVNVSDGANMIHVFSRSENHVCEREWLLLCSKITWCYTDVSNTVLILAVRLLKVNQLLCPDTAPLSAQYVNENHIRSDSSLCAVGSRLMNKSQREHESRPHSSLSERRQFRPAWSRLSSTELRKELISSWSDSVHLKDLFVQTTNTTPVSMNCTVVWPTAGEF